MEGAVLGIVPPNFSPDMSANEWETYLELIECNMEALEIKQPNRKLAYLKSSGKEPLIRLLKNLKPVNPEGVGLSVSLIVDNYQREVAKLNEFFERAVNPLKAAYEFNLVKQQPFERMKQFEVRVRQAAAKCKFENSEERGINGTADKKLVNILLMGKIQTVEEAVKQGITNELLLNQRKPDDSDPLSINKIRSVPVKKSRVQCYHCRAEHYAYECPKIKCHYCKEKGHTKRSCPKLEGTVVGRTEDEYPF